MDVIVHAADHDRVNDDRTEVEIDVERKDIHMHPYYDRDTVEHDVAILKLPEALPIGSRDSSSTFKIDYACLPELGDIPKHGTRCWAAGWGDKSEGGKAPQDLREVELEIFSDSQCARRLVDSTISFMFFPEFEICAGDITDKGERDTCQGDSGGPLMCAIDGQPVLVGVTSYGDGCARQGKPGVYAEVSASDHLNWIVSLLEH